MLALLTQELDVVAGYFHAVSKATGAVFGRVMWPLLRRMEISPVLVEFIAGTKRPQRQAYLGNFPVV